MSIQFTTSTRTVGELFSNGKIYELPQFQRAYSWSEEQAYQLFEDLHNACLETDDNKGTEYFLGSLVTVEPAKPHGAKSIVDGQQRLVTLTAILSILRDSIPKDHFRKSLQEHIERPDNGALGFDRSPRIVVRTNDQDAFQTILVDDDGTTSIPHRIDTLSMVRLVSAIKRVKAELPNASVDFYRKLIRFILNRCSFVVIEASSLDTAYKLFKSVNNRGTPLDELALARAELVGPVIDNQKESWKLVQAWDDLQDRLSEDDFRGYIMSVAQTVVPDCNLDLYLLIRKISSDRMLADRFQKNLSAFILNFEGLESANIKFSDDSERINRHIHCLLNYEIQGWRSAALIWLSEKRTNKEHYDFFRYLDGLVLGLTILYGKKSSVVTKRFASLVSAIKNRSIFQSAQSPIYLTSEEKKKIRERIDIPQRSFAKSLLLRLNAEATAIEMRAPYPTSVEIEHILPQKPSPAGEWVVLFSDTERKEYTYLLGNLTILTRKGNASARNAPFAIKKERVFGLDGNNCFALTNNLITIQYWTPATLRSRHDRLKEHAFFIMHF